MKKWNAAISTRPPRSRYAVSHVPLATTRENGNGKIITVKVSSNNVAVIC